MKHLKMMYKYNILVLLYCISITCALNAPVVSTTKGQVSGLVAEDGDYYMYLGIPYGKVDPNNPFGRSSPAPAFEGTFNAIDDSAICPQIEDGVVIGSLDCLHLNVFVPSTANTQKKLPVLIFIHGGGFLTGFYGRYIYGAKFLIRHNIILVTMNYRLGAYGFMCTDNPRVPGNQAMKDQLMALRWIHENIENFGGDPNKVTLSGNSAGAMTSDLQIIRNSDEKLFHQAILQSGVSFFPAYPPTVRNLPLILADHFGFKTRNMDEALDFLVSVDHSQILLASFQLGLDFRPCIERSFNGVEPFLTENWVSKKVIPTAKDLNIMIGFCENEALGLYLLPESDISNIVNKTLNDSYAIDHKDFSGTEEVRHFFFGDDEIDESKFKEAINLKSDVKFVHTSMRSIYRYLKSNVGKIYLYLFSYDGERNVVKSFLNTTVEGAVHGDELSYLYDVSFLGEPTVEDQRTIDRMTEMWANFVKYGDPTPQLSELIPVKWHPITPSSPHHYMHIGSNLEAGTSPYNERIAFWDLFHEMNKHLQTFILDNAEDLYK